MLNSTTVVKFAGLGRKLRFEVNPELGVIHSP